MNFRKARRRRAPFREKHNQRGERGILSNRGKPTDQRKKPGITLHPDPEQHKNVLLSNELPPNRNIGGGGSYIRP